MTKTPLQRTGQIPRVPPSIILDKETARYIFRALLLTIVFCVGADKSASCTAVFWAGCWQCFTVSYGWRHCLSINVCFALPLERI